MVQNNFTAFYFDGGENKQGARWVKDTKNYQICLNKQYRKDTAARLLFLCYIIVGPRIWHQNAGIPMRSETPPFFAKLFLYFYESRQMKSR